MTDLPPLHLLLHVSVFSPFPSAFSTPNSLFHSLLTAARNTKHHSNEWKICGDLEATMISPYVPTVMRKIVPRLMLVVPLLKVDPATVIRIPVIIFRPCILPSGRGVLSIDVLITRRSPS